MADNQIQAEFKDKEVKKFFEDLDKNLKKIENGEAKYKALLSAITYKDVINHFEKQEGSEDAWSPWSEIYQEHMQKIGKGGNKILQDTGKLRNNFQPTNVKKVKDGFLWFNNAQTAKGFPYAFAHNEGGPKLPKRDFMWLSQEAFDNIAEQTLKFLAENK